MPARFGLLEIPRGVNAVLEHGLLAEELGFDWLGIPDSQSLYRETFTLLGMLGHATERIRLGPTVTNPLTRHPAVMASAIATVHEMSGGRAMLGIGTGDSAVFNINERPRGLKGLRDYVSTLRALLRGEETRYNGRDIHTRWISGQKAAPVPIYIAAEGPKTLELAGEIADGVICGMGVTPEVIALMLDHIETGAKRAGRRLEDLDLWAFAKVNIGDNRAALIDEIRMELASTAHHAFLFTQEGKLVPPEFADGIARIQEHYQPSQHLALGDSPNARLMEDEALLSYLAERFAVLGTAEDCIAQITDIRAAGIDQILFTGNIADRAALVRRLGTMVLPHCRD